MAMDERVLRVCQQCAMEHIADIEAAMDAVKKQLKVPKLPEWIACLVDNALREQIHFARKISNRKLRMAAGAYGGPGKVGASPVLDQLADSVWQKSVLQHTINGWLLGDIQKEDLLTFAEAEDQKAAGSLFNAALCRKCHQVCVKKKGDTVRECMSESQVERIFAEIAKKMGRGAA